MEKIEARDVNFYYGAFHALKGISMEIPQNQVVAFIGPSGCGKSTFLRLFNRMNDLIPGTRLEGQILIDGQDIYGADVHVDELRKNVGMVFQRPNPFPKSIFDNVGTSCARMWGWSSRGPIPSPRAYLTMWPTACGSTV